MSELSALIQEPLRVSDVELAASLIALGMRPKLLPARDPVYADLVRRYGTDEGFKDLVNRVAAPAASNASSTRPICMGSSLAGKLTM